jgi:hypothetical protein
MRTFRSLKALLVLELVFASVLAAQDKRKVIIDQDAAGPVEPTCRRFSR